MNIRLERVAAALTPGLALALMAALAGCAATPDQSERETIVQSPLPALVTGPVDGIYRGHADLTSATAPGCPNSTRGLLEIGDRRVLFPYNADLTFISPVGLDGKIQARDGGYEFDGTLRDGHLAATITGAGCSTQMAFDRLAFF